jgi:hypothetical protein
MQFADATFVLSNLRQLGFHPRPMRGR